MTTIYMMDNYFFLTTAILNYNEFMEMEIAFSVQFKNVYKMMIINDSCLEINQLTIWIIIDKIINNFYQ